jgi:hypothetical protein
LVSISCLFFSLLFPFPYLPIPTPPLLSSQSLTPNLN